LNVAGSFVRSVELLAANVQTVEVWGIALLSSHTLEVVLKAFLLARGVPEDELIKIGHNLEKTWRAARAKGLPIEAEPPRWCTLLNLAHDRPYLVRYPPTNTGIVLPNLNDLSADLRGIYELVEKVYLAE
jgi:hypothetical protein